MLRYRRTLPHIQPPGVELFVTWRLHGSPPPVRAARGTLSGEQFAAFDRTLEADRRGPLWLANPAIAACVVDTLHAAELRSLCRLHAWVLMANHVHLLATPQVPLPTLMCFLKGDSARRANAALGRSHEPFWAREFYDHWVRNDEERRRIHRYIVYNPVKAGLVERPQDWPWSSVTGIDDLRP